MTQRDTMDRQMRQVLAELAMVSNGRITAYNSAGGGDNDESVLPPTGDESPPHLHWARRYGAPFHLCTFDCDHRERSSKDDDERQAVLEQARADLNALRRSEHVAVADLDDPEVARSEMLKATRGWKPEDVERSRWRTPARLVRRNRVTAGLHSETGEAIDEVIPPDGIDPRQRAQELKGHGMSIRQIAMVLGKHKTQIERYLGRAA